MFGEFTTTSIFLSGDCCLRENELCHRAAELLKLEMYLHSDNKSKLSYRFLSNSKYDLLACHRIRFDKEISVGCVCVFLLFFL